MNKLSEPFKVSEVLYENLIPEGVYPATVLDSNVSLANDGEQEVVVLLMEMTMLSGEKREVVDHLRINSKSEIARQIARRNFADLLISIGIEEFSDPTDLKDKSLRVRATVKANEGWKPLNNFSYLAPITPAAEQKVSEIA